MPTIKVPGGAAPIDGAGSTPDTYTFNPPFDKRMLMQPPSGQATKKLERGFIVTDQMEGDGTHYGVRFLRNPSVLQLSHALDMDLMPMDANTQPNQEGTHPMVSTFLNTLSVSLLFDRTFELWDSSLKDTELAQRGVYVDVLALYNIVGLTSDYRTLVDTESFVPSTDTESANAVEHSLEGRPTGVSGESQVTAGRSDVITSPLMYRPVWLYVGGPLRYYGVISSLGVQYTHWSHKMVPSRAQVDISFTVLPTPSVADSGSVPWLKDIGNRFLWDYDNSTPATGAVRK